MTGSCRKRIQECIKTLDLIMLRRADVVRPDMEHVPKQTVRGACASIFTWIGGMSWCFRTMDYESVAVVGGYADW